VATAAAGTKVWEIPTLASRFVQFSYSCTSNTTGAITVYAMCR
jgi:hypothetical protein